MQFTGATMSLCLATMAMAAPNSLEMRQDTTVVGSIGASIGALLPVLPAAEAAIQSAVASVLNASVGVEAQVIAAAQVAISSNLDTIITALNASGNAIAAATIEAAGGVIGVAATLTQAEINELSTDIGIVQAILSNINATVTGTGALSADVQLAVSTEVDALKAILKPFVDPLKVLAQAVITDSAKVTVTINGVQNAITGLNTVVGSLLKNLGLPL